MSDTDGNERGGMWVRRVTRMEVIDEYGNVVFGHHAGRFELQVQDGGRTLKIWIRGGNKTASEEHRRELAADLAELTGIYSDELTNLMGRQEEEEANDANT